MSRSTILEARVYKATMEEMNNFAELTATASDIALQCGAVRIDPPPQWNPPPSQMTDSSRFFVRTQLLPEAPFVDLQLLARINSKTGTLSQPARKRRRYKAKPKLLPRPQAKSPPAETSEPPSQQVPPAQLPANVPTSPAQVSANAPTQPSAPGPSRAVAHPQDRANPLDKTGGHSAPAPESNQQKAETVSFCRLNNKLRSASVVQQSPLPQRGHERPQLRSQPVDYKPQPRTNAKPNDLTKNGQNEFTTRSQPLQSQAVAPAFVNKQVRRFRPPFEHDDVPIPRKSTTQATHAWRRSIAPRPAWHSGFPNAVEPLPARYPFTGGSSAGLSVKTTAPQTRIPARAVSHIPQIHCQQPCFPQQAEVHPPRREGPTGSQHIHPKSTQSTHPLRSFNITPSNRTPNTIVRNGTAIDALKNPATSRPEPNVNSGVKEKSGALVQGGSGQTAVEKQEDTVEKMDGTALGQDRGERKGSESGQLEGSTTGGMGNAGGATLSCSVRSDNQATSATRATQTLERSPGPAQQAIAGEESEGEITAVIQLSSATRSKGNRKRRVDDTERVYHQDASGKLSKPITFSYSDTPISLKDFKRRTRTRLQQMYTLMRADEELQMYAQDGGRDWHRNIDRVQQVFWHALSKGIAGTPLSVDYGVDVEVEGAFDSKQMSYAERYEEGKQPKSSNRTGKSCKRERVKSTENVRTDPNTTSRNTASGSPNEEGREGGSEGAASTNSERVKCNIRNLNQETLLRFLPQMPGITRSMYYVGQLFTRFCWHTEDGYLNSISYLHEGSAAKVWYAVPPEFAPAFERYASDNVFSASLLQDNTCAQQLLMNKTTMFDPRELVKHGIPVYRVVHMPRSFVITAPRAYHAGFNCGLNIAEAVNFAHPTWFPHGREAMSFARRVSTPMCIPWEYLVYHEGRRLQKTALPLLAAGSVPPRVKRHAGIVAKELERIIREGEEQIRSYAQRERVPVILFSKERAECVSIGSAYGYNAGVTCSLCGHASHFYAELCGSCDVSDEARCTKHFCSTTPLCTKDGHFSVVMRRHEPVKLLDVLEEVEQIAGIETSVEEQLRRYKLFVRPWTRPVHRSGLALRMNIAAVLSHTRITDENV